MSEPNLYDWQLAEVIVNRRAMFVLWAIKTLFCTRKSDFLRHYQLTDDELTRLLNKLLVQGFVQQDGQEYVLTELGEKAVSYLGELQISQFAQLARETAEVDTRFAPVRAGQEAQRGQTKLFGRTAADIPTSSLPVDPEAQRGQAERPTEATLVEEPLIRQLQGLGWGYINGNPAPAPETEVPVVGLVGVPLFTERSNFREVLLEKRLRNALYKINTTEDGQQWLDEQRVEQAVEQLRRVQTTTGQLMQTNQETMDLLLKGTRVVGDAQLHDGRNVDIKYIDFEHPYDNNFLIINQFRVDLPGLRYIVPDVVLFVNGIPLVVIECKHPALTNPIEEGIRQLLRYSGQGGASSGQDDMPAAEQLFNFNHLLISTCFYQARFATIGASYEHYQEWKDPYPLTEQQLAQHLGVDAPSSQQQLVAGMLSKTNLLDLLYNFTLFRQSGNRIVKIVARYHQFRAVQKAIHRLQTGKMKQREEEEDRRGGIIWHTQGSGKSLTMVFLIRKLYAIERLKEFRIVFVTDRKDLQDQLKETIQLTGKTSHTVETIRALKPLLAPGGPSLVFAMLQKYQRRDDQEYDDVGSVEDEEAYSDEQLDKEINPSPYMLVLADEAHRSHGRELHAKLLQALPYCVQIGFTGTPIIMGDLKKTQDIFGSFIDIYTIYQSELDGATLPILYEGRVTELVISQRPQLDETYEHLVEKQPRQVREVLPKRYATSREILESSNTIETKARDMLLHYTTNILPNGFKAMVIAASRLAAVRYQDALHKAQQELVIQLRQLSPEQLALPESERVHLDENTQQLLRAHPQLAGLEQIEFAAVISHDARDREDDRIRWSDWTDTRQQEDRIRNFKKPLALMDPAGGHNLAFLCVHSMLITGFDAPIVQVIYLDRYIKNYELLQAIARVNRTYPDKTNGLVVDYVGLAAHLKEALIAYKAEDVQGALISLKDELPKLAERCRRACAIFETRGLSIQDTERCVNLLRDLEIRADFELKLKKFLESMDIVLPRPEALAYVSATQWLGLINRAAHAVYRDEQINLQHVGNKVRRLIDQHIEALNVRQLVEPISITDEDFESKLHRHTSDETNAAEMEHYARYYISQKFEQTDPAYYNTLSQRLEAILQSLQNNWTALTDELENFIHKARKPRDIDKTGLDPVTERPFLGILEEEVRKDDQRYRSKIGRGMKGEPPNDVELQELASFTRELLDLIRNEIKNIDFWRYADEQTRVRREIGIKIDKLGLVPHQRSSAVAARLISLARALHVRLLNQDMPPRLN